MKQTAENDQLLFSYLLGELTEKEQEQIEQRYISDPDFYEQLLATEDDLIDAYTEGALPESSRAGFERHFLRSPERQARVAFAKALITYVSKESLSATTQPEPAPKPFLYFLRLESWPIALRLAAVTVILLAIVFPIVQTVSLRNRLEQAETERAKLEENQNALQRQIDEERRRTAEMSGQLEIELAARESQIAAPTSGSGVVSFLLTAGLVRGSSQSRRLAIPPDARQVRLHLSFRGARSAASPLPEYESYSVVIKTVDGKMIWDQAGFRAQNRALSKAIVVPVPSRALSSDDYILTLSGLTPAGSTETVLEYFFSVSKQ